MANELNPEPLQCPLHSSGRKRGCRSQTRGPREGGERDLVQQGLLASDTIAVAFNPCSSTLCTLGLSSLSKKLALPLH